jgi:hypothetical protein
LKTLADQAKTPDVRAQAQGRLNVIKSEKENLQNAGFSETELKTLACGLQPASMFLLYYYSRPVTQDFSHAAHDLCGVIADAYNCVGAALGGVLAHELKGIVAGFLAQFGEQRDVAAHQRARNVR